MWHPCTTEGEDMIVIGTTDIIMTGKEGDMTATGKVDITMTGEKEDRAGTGTADMAMTGIKSGTKNVDPCYARYRVCGVLGTVYKSSLTPLNLVCFSHGPKCASVSHRLSISYNPAWESSTEIIFFDESYLA